MKATTWVNIFYLKENQKTVVRKTLAKKKMDVGEMIDVLEENKDMLIKKVRGLGPVTYEKLINKLKEKVNSN